MSEKLSGRAAFVTAAAASIILIGAGCGESVVPKGPITLVAVSGNAQLTLPDGQVPRPLVVRALDTAGAPRPGLLVHWTGNNGSRFAFDTSRTDTDGKASGIWVLGTIKSGYTANAGVDGVGSVSFGASADAADLTVSAVPDTLRFNAIGDTGTIKIHVRSATLQLDTLIDPGGWTAPTKAVATPVFVGTRMLLRSASNGTAAENVSFGNIPVPFVATVQQAATGYRIICPDWFVPAPDTIEIIPDRSCKMAIVATDSHGQPIDGVPVPHINVWRSSNRSIAGTDSILGYFDGNGEGWATITAVYDGGTIQTAAHVWTLNSPQAIAGDGSTCALRIGGSVACWGFRNAGLKSDLDVALAPEIHDFGRTFTALSLSSDGACGLTSTGAAYCWGNNGDGQLGTGSIGSYSATPVAVSGNIQFASISAGATTNCGLSTAGKAYCWGSAENGALGDGTFGVRCASLSCRAAPTTVAGGHTFTQISVGGSHVCAVATDQRGYCWGENRFGQLGVPPAQCIGSSDPTTSNDQCSNIPMEVGGLHHWKSVSVGRDHSCGLTLDGSLFCWGSNLNYVLGVTGIPELNAVNAEPLAVNAPQGFSAVYAGSTHTCAIDGQGGAWCWGLGSSGQLGVGAPLSGYQCANGFCLRTPRAVTGYSGRFSKLTVGTSHTCGHAARVYCWGSGSNGALGNGTTSNQFLPVEVLFQELAVFAPPPGRDRR